VKSRSLPIALVNESLFAITTSNTTLGYRPIETPWPPATDAKGTMTICFGCILHDGMTLQDLRQAIINSLLAEPLAAASSIIGQLPPPSLVAGPLIAAASSIIGQLPPPSLVAGPLIAAASSIIGQLPFPTDEQTKIISIL